MVRYVTDAFKANKIVGVGERASMKMHGLRSSVITQRFRAGMGDSVSLRSGDRDPRSFQWYSNLHGTLGKRQQESILGNFQKNPTKRMASVSKGDAALSFGVRGNDEVFSEDKENCARNKVVKFVEEEAVSTVFDAVVREPEVVLPSVLRNHGHFSGNVTIEV
ncbi:hypothetical protein FGB62_16g313 [Gracilaria domingensis]|nr:hypothetical protein FGB62_16g313 [Gracilaria domingensis]